MSKNYTQLSLVQRYQIEAFLKAGMKQKNIAEAIKVNPSTISRELSRNTAKRGRTAGEYVADNAQRKTEQRHHNKPKAVKFSTQMKEQAVRWLSVEKWSPEIISVEGHKTGMCPISENDESCIEGSSIHVLLIIKVLKKGRKYLQQFQSV